MSSVNESSVEGAVIDRYAAGAKEREEALCCPVSYNQEYLKKIPAEIIEKDYGCGDPSQFLKEGETVLDLGSGGGKICYIASQVVGPKGKVIGVDFNPTMLALARKYQAEVAKSIGWTNVEFRRGKIQDLKTNLEAFETGLAGSLQKNPITSLDGLLEKQAELERLSEKNPLVESNSIDVIVSNCVLNLVKTGEKQKLFHEMFRVLKRGGRVAISDIVSDEEVPLELQNDGELWSGCISGAFEERAFVNAFEEAGFYGVKIEKRDEKPWKVVKGIEFRSVTITAYKGKEGVCLERNQAVIYKGPWKQVLDDDQHILRRGERTAVCDKTFQIYSKDPYREDMILIEPYKEVSLENARDFDCRRNALRHPKETKGEDYLQTSQDQTGSSSGSCC